MLRHYVIPVLFVSLFLFIAASCSSSGQPTQPEGPAGASPISIAHETQSSSHECWGLYQFFIDPDARTLEFVALREARMHLNALNFLEPSSPPLLALETVEFSGNSVTAGIGLRHPFLGLDEFTGFDVCGIVITDGNLFGFVDNEIRMAHPEETRLVNADGYSRWWNPKEFPHTTTMFGYQDGLMGLPDEVVEYSSTINGYKYFCDDLDSDDPVFDVDVNSRGVFSAGQKNVRDFEIKWDQYGLIFNYAIDASWVFPSGDYPWDVPEDFGPNANRPEAWNIVVTETDNTLFNDGTFSGGDLSLSIDIYDWYNPELNILRVESPGCFDAVNVNTPTGGGPGYSTYEVDITGINPPEEYLDILITAECEVIGYQDMLPGRKVSAYQRHFAEVSGEG